MIRTIFISRINVLSGRTHVYNISKTAEAIGMQPDLDITFITSGRVEDQTAFFQKMGIKKPYKMFGFNIASMPEVLALIVINLRYIYYLTINSNFDVLYFRDDSLAVAAWWTKTVLRKKVFFEIHSVLQSKKRQMLNRLGAHTASGMIAISSGLKGYYSQFNKNIIVSLCSAAEDDWFDYKKSKEEFRTELNLPKEKYLVGYIGVVGANPNNDYYEIDDIVRSLALLPENIVLVIGGELNHNADWLREIAKENGVSERILVLPWLERSKVPKYLQAFDVNVIPKRKKDLIGDSPAKMFPVLASKVPMVAGKAESIEEVLTHDSDALIVESNSKEGWAEAILKIYNNPTLGERLALQAFVTKNKYTWEKRGDAIGEFIRKSFEKR